MREAVNRRGEKVKEIMSVLREREREGEREIQTLICSICDRERVLRHMSRYL